MVSVALLHLYGALCHRDSQLIRLATLNASDLILVIANRWAGYLVLNGLYIIWYLNCILGMRDFAISVTWAKNTTLGHGRVGIILLSAGVFAALT